MPLPSARLHCSIITGLLLSLFAAPALAHEFWLEPSAYRVDEGDLFRIVTRHGERFDGDVVPRHQPYVVRYELIGRDGATEVQGRHGGTTSFARPATAGPHQVVFLSAEISQRLDAKEFEAYLAEERLESIAKLRQARGESDEPGREVYVRCSKSLIDVADTSEAPIDRVTGLPLEIVVTSADATGIEAKVLYQGTPLSGIRVVAVAASNPDRLIELATDAKGLIRVPAGATGPWMLTTLHMVRTEGRTDADWKSFWASTTFDVAGSADPS